MNDVFFLQLRVVAYDQGEGDNEKSATVIVKININRNFNDPLFQQTSYGASIVETQDYGVSIAKVSATDADRTVSKYINH